MQGRRPRIPLKVVIQPTEEGVYLLMVESPLIPVRRPIGPRLERGESMPEWRRDGYENRAEAEKAATKMQGYLDSTA